MQSMPPIVLSRRASAKRCRAVKRVAQGHTARR